MVQPGRMGGGEALLTHPIGYSLYRCDTSPINMLMEMVQLS